MAFGTWGGYGPEGYKVLSTLVKRAAAWQEGSARAAKQDELFGVVGVALMTQVWATLFNKNYC